MIQKVGFIGLGEMGDPMARNLIKAGFDLWVSDIVTERVDELAEAGANASSSPSEVGANTEISITMVPASSHVREAVLGENGLIHGIKPPHIHMIMSTIDPMTVTEVAMKLAEKGVKTIDAPVARSRAAAIKGTLAIFVGGEEDVYQTCFPLLKVMGKDILQVGKLGNGQVVKIINNMILAVSVAALSEAMVLGVKAGVDPDTLVESLTAGSADSFALRNHIKTYAMKDDLEGRFPVNYIMKDLDLALSTGTHHHVPLLFTAMAQQLYERARASGWEHLYYPVILHDLENLTDVKVRSADL
jgi:3-hydroxyisobutyrate dehydrogenase-like beta-hydroxyacid dehydrogenase